MLIEQITNYFDNTGIQVYVIGLIIGILATIFFVSINAIKMFLQAVCCEIIFEKTYKNTVTGIFLSILWLPIAIVAAWIAMVVLFFIVAITFILFITTVFSIIFIR